MPGPYTPPQPRRSQAVPWSRRGGPPRWRTWWLVPAIGLVPVLLATVLATQGAFSPRSTQPVASVPTSLATGPPAATPAAAQPQPTAAATAVPTTSTAAAQPAATAQAAASPPQAEQPTPRATQAVTFGNAPYLAYRVQSGDTLRFVAQMYGVSVASIAQASGLQNPDLVRVGQVLTVPAQPGWLYRLQPGETLDQVSARTGVASDVIVSASGLTAARVGPGAVILIPDQLLAKSK